MKLASLHQHYAIISKLSAALHTTLLNAKITFAATFSKNELQLSFDCENHTVFSIQLSVLFRKCFLFFGNVANVKRSNTQLLFDRIIGSKVTQVEQHVGNRSFELLFENGYSLVFKMYDGLANVLLFEGDQVVELFRTDIVNDNKLTHANFAGSNNTDYDNATAYYLYENDDKTDMPYALTVHDFERQYKCIAKFNSVFEAYNQFGSRTIKRLQFFNEKQKLLQQLSQKLGSTERFLHKTTHHLNELQTEVSDEEIGHIIMANLHNIKLGEKRVELLDFYRNTPIEIKLKETLSPQDNAAYYYRKAKNRAIELDLLKKQIQAHRDLYDEIQQKIKIISQATETKQLQPFLKVKNEEAKSEIPFKVFQLYGYEIWVGKNAANNDLLTLKYAHKNDLWLHAKDVSGSHVVIRHKAGKAMPADLIKSAAEIAAHYSKLKGSTLVPVAYTLKKYVRKPKGMLPGQVIVEKENVVMVEPKLPQ